MNGFHLQAMICEAALRLQVKPGNVGEQLCTDSGIDFGGEGEAEQADDISGYLSKAAIRNLARTWALDLRGTGIRVNVIAGSDHDGAGARSIGRGIAAMGASTVLGRMGDPSETGAVAAFSRVLQQQLHDGWRGVC